MRKTSFRISIYAFVSIVFMVSAAAQKPKALAPGQYSLTVKTGTIDLRANGARVIDISEELGKRVNARIILSEFVQAQTVSLDLRGLALEPTLQALAPRVFIDYKLIAGKQSPVVVYLSGENESEPKFEIAQNPSQAILFDGDTEEGVENKSEEAKQRIENNPLRISYANKKLSVRAKAQSLIFVVLKVGQELNIPVELKAEPREVITTEIVEAPVEDAVTRISPQVALYVRADLQRGERSLVRMVLEPASSETQGTANKQ
jgi:hypothetical protein